MQFFSQERKYKNDWEEYRLLGKVKTLKATKYQATNVNGKIVRNKKMEDDYSAHLIYFNLKGNEIECTFYIADTIDEKEIILYDEFFNVIEKISYAPDGVLKRKELNVYSKGKLIESTSYTAINNQRNRNIFFYNVKGKKIQENRFIDGGISQKIVFKYDTLDHVIEQNYSDYFYDADTSALLNKDTFQYNSKGQVVEYNSKTEEIFNAKVTYAYDNNGNETEWIRYKKDGSIDEKNITVYNSKGFVIEQDWYDEKGLYRKYTSEFKLDKKENWIEKITNENGKYYITIREIEYY